MRRLSAAHTGATDAPYPLQTTPVQLVKAMRQGWGCADEGSDVIAPGDVLDRYEIEALIARGGMADVFLARDRRLDRHVAIKAFRVGTADPARFDAETRLLARLTHRNLVSVFDAGEHDDVPFVVLQHVPGHTLATRLAAGPLPRDEVTRLARDVTAALEYVHAQRIVHRDVKPSNIFLHADGRSMLGDFGVAMLLDATRFTTDAAIIGTAAYLAPEQATGDTVTEAADVYALGLVPLESLTGLPAFAGSLQEVITAKLGRDPLVPIALDEPWPALLSDMTNRDPDLRPSAAEARDVLHNRSAAAAVVDQGVVVEPASAETVVLGDQEGSPTEIAPAAPRVVPARSRRRVERSPWSPRVWSPWSWASPCWRRQAVTVKASQRSPRAEVRPCRQRRRSSPRRHHRPRPGTTCAQTSSARSRPSSGKSNGPSGPTVTTRTCSSG